MVGLILIFGTVNLGLGYALAVWLGYGSPPPLPVGWQGALPAPRPVPARPAPAPAAVEQPAAAEPVAPPAEAAPPEPWVLDQTHVEAAVLRLNLAMLRSGAILAGIDSRLRALQAVDDRPAIKQCLTELVADCETYLVEQREAAERFRRRIGELGGLASVSERIELANLEQSAQVETTISNLRHLDVESDPTVVERLLAEIDGLRSARHRLRDSREIAFVDIARHKGRLSAVDQSLKTEPLTGLPNRIALEATLARWWAEGRPAAHVMAAALLDMDGFGQINKTHGMERADRVLRQVAQYLLATAGQDCLIGRYAGQRFLLVAEDVGPEALVELVELMRQSIGRMTFAAGTETIRLTASAAIAAVVPEAPREFLKRLEQMLAEARMAGANQSRLWEQGGSKRIEPPELAVNQREIAL